MLKINYEFTYFTLAGGGNIELYAIGNTSCTSSQFYDSDTTSCVECSSKCETCLNNEYCTTCSSGQELDQNGHCTSELAETEKFL